MEPDQAFNAVAGVALGVALASACGFRVFVPPLVLSVAALAGHVTLGPGLAWMATWPAVLALAVATVVEIAAYYVPWLDHLLDHLGAPLAVLAGVVVAAGALAPLPPLLRWTLAVVAGGGAAGAVHVSTAALRAVVGASTVGLGNFLVATAEAVLAVLVSVLAVVVPLAALLVMVVIALLAGRAWRGRGARAAAPG